jgi:uncharacterized protein (DUF849 family)
MEGSLDKRLLTCAVTGATPISSAHSNVPISPKEIAVSAIDAARAGATAVHIHVRDPVSRRGSMELPYYREVVDRIRDSSVDVLLNLTTGPGAQLYPSKDKPGYPGPGTRMNTAIERVQHVLELKPDICSLDFNTMWFMDFAFINPPELIAEMARLILSVGVMPELEIFDSGDVHLARKMLQEEVLPSPAFFQIALGTSYGAAADAQTMLYIRSLLPPGCRWAAFGVSRHAFPMLAQAYLLGGHVRIGLEDNLYLKKGELAPDNASLVRKALDLLRQLGGEAATPKEARQILGLAPSLGKQTSAPPASHGNGGATWSS